MKRSEPVVGGLYASRDSDGLFTIVKVLVVDESAIHLRSYADRFRVLPESISSSQLSLGGIGNPIGIGIGHFPIGRAAFAREERVLLTQEPVLESELDGYRIYAGDDDEA